jgi:hypothetical protein
VEAVVMVIQVATQDAESAKRLVTELVGVFGGESVSLDPAGEIEVHSNGESNRTLIQSLEAVERWLEAAGIPSAEVRVDGRSYKVHRAGSLHRLEERPANAADRAGRDHDRQRIRTLEQENRQLRIALESRVLIEQAKGALTVTRGVAPEDAFQLLRRQARNERRDIHAVAAEVVRNRRQFEVSVNGNGRVTGPPPL